MTRYKTFKLENSIAMKINCNYRIAAVLHTLETWHFRYIIVYTLHKGDDDDNNSNNNNIKIYQSFLSPTDAQENCFKRNIKIYITTAPTCFGIRECTFELAKVTVVKIIN
jgi:hypothetical protein